MLVDFDILDYYKSSSALIRDYGFRISEIENMIPFEYEIYMLEVLKFIEEKIKHEKQN